MEKELVEYIASNLVNDTDAVRVKARKNGGTLVLHLNVAKGDMGRVIGKQGRVANAIRSLLKATASRKDIRVVLDID
ncbi:MAG: KH domain-containing protein [Chloroflexota bacterium]